MKIIQIFGLAHGGTTVTDRLLSCHPGVIGLGEVSKVFERLQRGSGLVNERCPCGGNGATCPIWAPIIADRPTDPARYYGDVVEIVRRSGARAFVDSSKDRGQIRFYRDIARDGGGVDSIFVVRLLRDPRGWVQSFALRKKVPETDADGLRALFYEWLLSSLRLDLLALGSNVPFGYVWYDALVLDRQEGELAGLIGIDPLPPGPLMLGEADQHAINGNKFVFTDRRLELRYDSQWLRSRAIEEVYTTLPQVRAYYHEAQKLHLTRDTGLTNLPGGDILKLLRQPRGPDWLRAVEDLIDGLDVRAPMPARPADARRLANRARQEARRQREEARARRQQRRAGAA